MSELATVGEQLLGRKLKKEFWGGVPHYIPGQYDAVTYGEHVNFHDETDVNEIARLTYVDVMGHACVVLCARPPGGEWRPTWLSRSGHSWRSEVVRAPEEFRLSDKMLAALAKARAESPDDPPAAVAPGADQQETTPKREE